MYYEKRKNNYLGIFLILLFLLVIIFILVNLINKIDRSLNLQKITTEETGTDTVLAEFSVKNLAENSSYSVVRNFQIK